MPERNPDPKARNIPAPGSGDASARTKRKDLVTFLREYLGFTVTPLPDIAQENMKKDAAPKAPARLPVSSPAPVHRKTVHRRPAHPVRGDEALLMPEMEKSLRDYMKRRMKRLQEADAAVPDAGVEEESAGAEGEGDSRWAFLAPFLSKRLSKTEKRTEELSRKISESEKKTEKLASLLSASQPAPQVKTNQPAEQIDLAAENAAGRGKLLPGAAKEEHAAPPVLSVADVEGLLPQKKAATMPVSAQDKEGLFMNMLQSIRELKDQWKEVSKKQASMQTQAQAAAEKPAVPVSAQAAVAATPTARVVEVEDGKTEKDDKGALSNLLSNFKEGAKKEEVKREQPKQEKDDKKDAAGLIKVAIRKRSNGGLSQFFSSIKYFGLGKERLTIVQNLATMLNAGLPLVDAVRTLQMETRVKPAKKLLQRIIDAVESGSPLWRAMDDQQFFSPHAIALIRIGEEAGNLAQNMEYLAAQQEKDQGLRQKVKMAMIYPTIVLTLMFIIVMGLGMFVLPNLVQVLFSLNVKLPLITRIVIAFTNGFTQYGTIVVPSILVGVVVFIILAKFTSFRVVVQWGIFHIPGIGRLATEATLARFGVIMGGLLQAGVPLVDSLKSLAEVTPIVRYRNFYKKLLEHISVGDSFSKSFTLIRGSAKVIPVSVQQLIITGERTGSLAKVMLKVADIYEKKANDTAAKLPVILEPMLLLFIGALVGTIAFAIIIPIYSIVGNVSH